MTDTSPHPLPSPQRALITIGVMAATLMQVLDQTIANVALPHMQAALGANQETVAWVLTSYILTSAIAMPVTGWLAGRFGTRRLFITATIGFTLASMACGLAGSLVTMVLFRALQGLFGAFLVPLAQAVLFNIYPREKHTQAITLWGICVMVAPVLGPVVGGWLTDSFNWRWVFFINLPFGVLAVILMAMIPNTEREERRFDIAGFALLGLALSAAQLILDRGTQLDWLNSWEIRIELGIAIAASWMFVIHLLTTPQPLLNRALFKDRNFVVAQFMVLISSGMLIASAVLIAPMLQHLMGYSPTDAGFAIMPRGLGVMFSMVLVGQLIKYIDGRLLIFTGLLLTAWSLRMMCNFTLDMDQHAVIVSGLIQGVGFGLVVMPLNLMAFATLEPRLRTEATALYSLSRSLGGSIAISITTALVARNLQISHSDLGSHITLMRLPWLDASISRTVTDNGIPVLAMLDAEINRQALMIAYVDNFYLMFWAFIGILPLLLLMRKSAQPVDSAEAMAVAD